MRRCWRKSIQRSRSRSLSDNILLVNEDSLFEFCGLGQFREMCQHVGIIGLSLEHFVENCDCFFQTSLSHRTFRQQYGCAKELGGPAKDHSKNIVRRVQIPQRNGRIGCDGQRKQIVWVLPQEIFSESLCFPELSFLLSKRRFLKVGASKTCLNSG